MKRKIRTGRSRVTSSERVIALLTDFGDHDHYVGVVKGVILSINPGAQIVHLSNNVMPQNIREAGYLLWASYRFFPERALFVCIVDPGVGSDRRIVCLETKRHTFLAPDNGLLDFIRLEEKILRSYEIERPPIFGMSPISSTFHGRDIFAPLAGQLSLGKSVKVYGRQCTLDPPAPVFYESDGNGAAACILHIDTFGNVITNVPAKYFDEMMLRIGSVEVRNHIRNFSEGPQQEPCLIVGSSNLVEVVLKNGNAAKYLGAQGGTPIRVRLGGETLV